MLRLGMITEAKQAEAIAASCQKRRGTGSIRGRGAAAAGRVVRHPTFQISYSKNPTKICQGGNLRPGGEA